MKFKLAEELNNSELILFHNTPFKNIDSILKNGILVESSESEKASGWQMIWATNHPLTNDEYGGNIIKFKVPEECRFEKVNNDQYLIYDDIPPDCILGVDILLGDGGTGFLHQSELPQYIKEYGKETLKKVMLHNHSEQITDEEFKQLTPELDW